MYKFELLASVQLQGEANGESGRLCKCRNKKECQRARCTNYNAQLQ